MKHVVFFSGGLGSWMTAKRVVQDHGTDNTICLFTDTFIEDSDLYRFMLETTEEIYGICKKEVISKLRKLPPTSHEGMVERRAFLKEVAEEVMAVNPNFVWISDGRDPWQVFKDSKYIGNSRVAQCSHLLKQKPAREYVERKYAPGECVLYLGIDWSEIHRTEAPVKNWAPYTVKFPMCVEPYKSNEDAISELKKLGIAVPRLYGKGFAHNNCGGFCVRGGQGHFANLLKHFPDLFDYHADKEQQMRDFLDKDVSILRRQRDGIRFPLTLYNLRDELGTDGSQVDLFDIGGCGCFVQDE